MLLGTVFAFSDTPAPWKSLLLVEPWITIPITMGSMFGTRYLSPLFAWSMYVASMLTALGFAAMVVGIVLATFWLRRQATR